VFELILWSPNDTSSAADDKGGTSVAYFKVVTGETEEDRDQCNIAGFKVILQYPKCDY
jgi:hypothetical protein